MTVRAVDAARGTLVGAAVALCACGGASAAAPAPVVGSVPASFPSLAPFVRMHAEAWERPCRGGGSGSRCGLMGADETDDGAVIVGGALTGKGSVFGSEATAAADESLLLSRIGADGAVAWTKILGAENGKYATLDWAEHVLALGGGLVAVAGGHGPRFDPGGGVLPSGPPERGMPTVDGFLALYRTDGTFVFAANLEPLVDGAERTTATPLRPLGLYGDGAGGAWVLAGREGQPLVAARVSPTGTALARIQYAVRLRTETGSENVALYVTGAGGDRVAGVLRKATITAAVPFALGPDGALFVAAADGQTGHALLLQRFGSDGAVTVTSLGGEYWWSAAVTAGAGGEAYVAASTTNLDIREAIVGGAVVPRLLKSNTLIARVERAGGAARWWLAPGPAENVITVLSARAGDDGALRVGVAYRDDLLVAGVRAPAPQRSSPADVTTPGFAVATLAEADGRLIGLDALSPTTTPCPSWLPAVASRVVLGAHQALLLSGARDASRDQACRGSFGFDGSTVLVSVPTGSPAGHAAHLTPAQ